METGRPAPYGRACLGCARAKAKCYYKVEIDICLRCERLRKPCEASTSVRKRKISSSSLMKPPQTTVETSQYTAATLSDLSSTSHGQCPTPSQSSSSPFLGDTPSALNSLVTERMNTLRIKSEPDYAIDSDASMVAFLRPVNGLTDRQYEVQDPNIFQDVQCVIIPEKVAAGNLDLFRDVFLYQFPFVHIDAGTSSNDLRRHKPFLWLVVMAISARRVDDQFAWEAVIWRIINQRIVLEHHANLDLLLGIICFASWNHYFKRDKPFMTLLSQMAVSIAFELNIHKDAPSYVRRNISSPGVISQQYPQHASRSLEERRTLLALFHVTSSTWTAYRKTEPLRWTTYMAECANELSRGSETDMDRLLAAQVRCQLITNQITCPPADTALQPDLEPLPFSSLPSMLARLNEIKLSLPNSLRGSKVIMLYLVSAESVLRDVFIRRPPSQDSTDLRRLQNLQETLRTTETWMATFFDLSLVDLLGLSVDIFSQFTRCLVILFKLTIIKRPDWDNEDVRRRADLFQYLDRVCERVSQVPDAVGMIDSTGPRRGLVFNTNYVLQAIKMLFARGMAQDLFPPSPIDTSGFDISSMAATMTDANSLKQGTVSEAFLASLAQEPWVSDMFGFSWTMLPEQCNEIDLGSVTHL